MCIRATDCHMFDAVRKNELVNIGSEFDIAPEKRCQLCWCRCAPMYDTNPCRYQSAICKLSAKADKGCQPKLNLVTIGSSFHVNVIEHNRGLVTWAQSQTNSLIHRAAIAFCLLQSVRHTLR